MKEINVSYKLESFINLLSGKKSSEEEDEEQIINTIKQSIQIFSGIGYRLRPLIPTVDLPNDIFNEPYKYKLDRVNFADLLDERKSYIAETEIIKAIFNNCIFNINAYNDVHSAINMICKAIRQEEFDISRISHEFHSMWRDGIRTASFKFTIGNKNFTFESVEERGLLLDLLVKFDSFLKQFKIGLYKIEGTNNFIILADAEMDIILGLSWKLSKNYFPNMLIKQSLPIG